MVGLSGVKQVMIRLSGVKQVMVHLSGVKQVMVSFSGVKQVMVCLSGMKKVMVHLSGVKQGITVNLFIFVAFNFHVLLLECRFMMIYFRVSLACFINYNRSSNFCSDLFLL